MGVSFPFPPPGGIIFLPQGLKAEALVYPTEGPNLTWPARPLPSLHKDGGR